MKSIDELHIRDDLLYAKTHEWSSKTASLIRVGVTDYAQNALGDVVYIELPEAGALVNANAAFGTIESAKAVSDLHSPVSGRVTAVNGALSDQPELVNSSPYDDGWMIEIEQSGAEEAALMSGAEYLAFIKTLPQRKRP
ncbi:MAG: glycine cleavage system protein GcvH [Synergistaceae bacterium]|jgi:glycine cleavage system H protein|nr:glycine cleavage system protein GcvH [Synergistaceae bacterium]